MTKKVIAFLFVQIADVAIYGLMTHPEVCPRIVNGSEVLANTFIKYGLYAGLVIIWIWSAMVLIGKRKKRKDESSEGEEDL